jgi:enoyl-CoA hydratase
MTVHYSIQRRVATITLDAPEKRNALSSALVRELSTHLQAAESDDAARAVVLTHTGRTFCAGADLTEQAAEGGPAEGTKRLLALLRAIVELPKPVLARVDGHVRAGGIGLLGACDIALAGPATTFAFTEARLGLAPAIISLTTAGRMNARAAARYYLTGETFDAGTAQVAGLITYAANDEVDLDAELTAVCNALRACSPRGLAETKSLTTAAIRAAFSERAEAMQALSQRLFESDEAREGIQAFLQKRAPRWAAGP